MPKKNKKFKKHSAGADAAASSVPKMDAKMKKKAKDLLIIAAITVVVLAVYIYFVQMWKFQIIFIIYLAVWTLSVLAYCFYNRGFMSKDITEDMLSPYWSEEKKKQFIESVKERRQKSRWLLFIITPFTFVFIIEIFMVFIMPRLYSMFSSFGS